MSRLRSAWPLFAGVFLLLAGAHHAAAADPIRIENVTWGFDGKAVPQAFNPLSFEIHNDGLEPFEGVIKVESSTGLAPVDAPIAEPIYLAPNSGRRVQLYPYVLTKFIDFSLSWGRGSDQRINLTAESELPIGEPAVVVLTDPYGLAPRGGGGLQRFDEAFFPISVTATTGLAAVVLDHEPGWQGQTARQEAFLDWLHAGGVVHLLQADSATYPTFKAPLDVLNTPLDDYPVGAGRVFRHSIALPSLDREFAETNIFIHNVVRVVAPPQPANAQNQNNLQNYPNFSYVNWDTNDQFFTRLRQMTVPDHNWWLIYLMSLVYLLIIFPGCWLIGRRRADYRITYGAMIAAVVLFSMGFKAVGQRGYGEQTALHSLTVARPVRDGRMMIQQWSNLFVTDGDDYRITHPGEGLLYSSGQFQEAVRGVVKNPPDGQFAVDIPPFSSRTIVSAAVLDVSGFQVDVEEYAAAEKLQSLRLKVGGGFPSAPQGTYALFRDQMYTLQHQDGTLSLRGGGQPLKLFLRPENWDQIYNNFGFSPFFTEDIDPAQLFAGALHPLIARSLGINSDERLQQLTLSHDRVRVFVFADMSAEQFPVTQYVEGDQTTVSKKVGRVLYTFDILQPE